MKFERKENEEVKKIMHCPVDLGFNILYDGKQVGHIFLNELIAGGYLVEWIEIFPEYRKKGYCKQVLMDMMDYLEIDEIQLEASEELLPMYSLLGTEKLDYDDIREMYLLKLRKLKS